MNDAIAQDTNPVPVAPAPPSAPTVAAVSAVSDASDAAPVDDEQKNEFQKVKERLEEIAQVVDSEEISLDDALDLYEEAVALGLQATDLLDVGITAQEEAQARILGEDGKDASITAEPVSPRTDEEGTQTESQPQGIDSDPAAQGDAQAE